MFETPVEDTFTAMQAFLAKKKEILTERYGLDYFESNRKKKHKKKRQRKKRRNR